MRCTRPAGPYHPSPLAYGGKVFCLGEDRETFVVRAGREFKVLGRNRLDEMALATPAVAGGACSCGPRGGCTACARGRGRANEEGRNGPLRQLVSASPKLPARKKVGRADQRPGGRRGGVFA